MTNVDQFASMFRSATREVFRRERIEIQSVLVVTDLDEGEARAFGERTRQFLGVIGGDVKIEWRHLGRSDFRSAGELLERVESAAPDLICTYRNLHSDAWKWPYSLGAHIDLLTQHTDVPVMLLPHPHAERSAKHANQDTDTVMAITDHLTGDDLLVNFALTFAHEAGTVWLTHVEDDATFARYIEVISKIATIETDDARDALRAQLLKEPQDYIDGCVEVLRAAGARVTIERLVVFGHHLSEYKRLIDKHAVDLLVLNTKDEDQLAMHGIAYALAVELRHIPLLML